MIRMIPGRCMVCGCTDRYGCATGCWWADAYHTLCSRCAHNMAVLVLAMRRHNDDGPPERIAPFAPPSLPADTFGEQWEAL